MALYEWTILYTYIYIYIQQYGSYIYIYVQCRAVYHDLERDDDCRHDAMRKGIKDADGW